MSRHFIQEDIQMTSIWKDAQYLQSSGKCNFKPQLDITVLEWQKTKPNQNRTDISEYMEQLEFSHCWCKMAQLLTVSCKIKHTLPIQPRNPTLTSTSKRNKNLYPHKNLYMIVYGDLIFNFQKLETTQMLMNWWVCNQSVLHPYIGILFSNKKE